MWFEFELFVEFFRVCLVVGLDLIRVLRGKDVFLCLLFGVRFFRIVVKYRI